MTGDSGAAVGCVDRQIWRVEVILPGNPHQGEQSIPSRRTPRGRGVRFFNTTLCKVALSGLHARLCDLFDYLNRAWPAGLAVPIRAARDSEWEIDPK